MTNAIVTTHYRPKRAPGKKRKQPALAQAIVTPAPMRRQAGSAVGGGSKDRLGDTAQPPRPAIVTVKHPPRRQLPDVPEETPEELQRRADAADELWRELVRRVREGS
jgi:hypothetical protein